MSTQDQLPCWVDDRHAVYVSFLLFAILYALVIGAVVLVAAWLGRITA